MKKVFSLMVASFLGFVVFAFGLVNAQWAWWFGDQTDVVKYNPTVPGATAGLQSDKLITSIKMFINRILWLLGLIALLMLLWGGFQMVTAAGDEAKYKKWFKILQQAGMWIIFIWVSWLFISVIFWLVSKFAW